MGAHRTGTDIATVVFGILMLILTVSLFGISGSIAAKTGEKGLGAQTVLSIQFGIASWYLVTSVFAIASGATGHKCPYVTVIVLGVFATLIAIAGIVCGALYIWTSVLDAAIKDNPNLLQQFENGYGQTRLTQEQLVEDVRKAIEGLPYGVLIVNGLSFIFMIVLSSLGCCGACCNTPSIPVQYAPGSTTVVTTSAGYSAMPPGYVSYPPNHQFQPNNTIANPQYGNDTELNSYKA